ncbi:MAG: DUF1223 domain-containing protein, partial [Betaproteobacteria bacterium]|nr:DUF1223 domain-containing protein [Betaproteobacteria bacterium]
TVTRQGSRTVYTPQIMLDGQDIRQTRFESSLRDITSRPARAALTLNTQTVANAIEVSLNVNVPDTEERKNSALYIAVTENNLVSQVTAGENRGVTLKHDHVVRELLGPIAMRAEGALDIKRSIAIPPAWKRENLQIAAFVQNQQNGAVAQAVSTPLCVAGR